MATAPDQPASPPLGKQYRPDETEPAVWQRWIDTGAFKADPQRVLAGQADPYCVLIPPPNVTAALHLGHALNNTLQDVLVRAHRMMGYEALWMPGTDHAGIATQTVVDRRLKAEGKPSIAQLRGTPGGREAFIAEVQAFKDEYERRITEQLQAMGCSCDWDRQRFTMDPVCARAVREAFFRLFKAGLIYRGKRLVNWDPASQTALADDEVEMEEVEGFFYYLDYPVVNDDATPTGEVVTVATTRPETYFGDTAVAVNPGDAERAGFIGRKVKLPFVNRVIPVIGDDYVVRPDPESEDAKAKYASGFLKVTPAHDPNDWLIGQRHNLPVINVMAPDASISADHGWTDVGDAGPFLGLSREDARKAVVEAFKKAGLLRAIKPYTHSVGHSYRSHVPIEPYLSDQWYCKVTDDRLRGAAQRALRAEQRTEQSLEAWPESAPASGGTGFQPVSSRPGIQDRLTLHRRNLPHWQLGGNTYFITFRVAEGELTHAERLLVLDACFHFHDDRVTVHLATVMPDHVHLLITPLRRADGAWHALPDLLHSIKSYTANQIHARRGTSGRLWQPEYFDRIVRNEDEFREKWNYMLLNPVKAKLCAEPWDYPFTRKSDPPVGRASSPSEGEQERDGLEARPTGEGEGAPGDGRLTFHPARYAKTYETWHDNLRDWCISRQLWWGHRIPVWYFEGEFGEIDPWQEPARYSAELQARLDRLRELMGCTEELFVKVRVESGHGEFTICSQGDAADELLGKLCQLFDTGARYQAPGELLGPQTAINRPDLFPETEQQLAAFAVGRLVHAVKQDPDVLDTWFSSALWPLSTMGWPDPAAAAADTGLSDFPALLPAFNPTSVLCTAREIITLWVSRMVMFNRLFRAADQQSSKAANPEGNQSAALLLSRFGDLPFGDVFIHAMIQDGEGRKMSKSLGNGVDPLDIIHSHGADAMRFTLVQMTTQTQDVRMPVERDPASGKNTSPKFDAGRNVCNKLWNAARFALTMLGDSPPEPGLPIDPQDLSLPDRWMLSRIAAANAAANAALKNYQFKDYADTLYDLLWRDFCDWYLEAVKPTIKADPNQRAVLRLSLDAILRLLHPIAPFITEAIFERLREVPARDIDGFAFASTRADDTLCQSGWPQPSPALRDEPAEDAFARMQALVTAIREVRAANQVPPKRRITLHAAGTLAADVARWSPLVETLAGLAGVESAPPTAASAAFTFEGAEHRLADLADAVDADAQRERLRKQLADLDKSITSVSGRLANPGYAERAPAHLVEQTRAQLAQLQADRATTAAALEALG